MAALPNIKDEIKELFKSAELDRVVYFHCDHWEPWDQYKPGLSIYCEENQQKVSDFSNSMARIDFARKLTLFYKPGFNFLIGDEISESENRPYRAVCEEDKVRFIERTPEEKAGAAKVIRELLDITNCELQLHLHHENLTYNTSQRTPARAAYLSSELGRSFEEQRIAAAIETCLIQIEEDSGFRLKDWFFVHGLWALQAADARVCHITREIEILMAHGCLGDFTCPSGRSSVDPRIQVPYFTSPINCSRGYDMDEGSPEYAFGNSTARKRGKFLVWSSPMGHRGASIDYYAPWYREKLEDPLTFIKEIIDGSFKINGTLYVKTHSHSMHRKYRENTRKIIFPHEYPGTQQLLSLLFDGAVDSGCQLDFLTAAEVYREFTTTKYEPPTGYDILTRENGKPAPDIVPPPKNWKRGQKPVIEVGIVPTPQSNDQVQAGSKTVKIANAPSEDNKSVDDSTSDNEFENLEDISVSDSEAPNQTTTTPSKSNIIEELTSKIDEIAVGVINDRINELGEKNSGAGSFYSGKAKNGAILADYEIALAKAFVDKFEKNDAIIDVGCGFGVLPILLAALGFSTEGIDVDSKRIDGSNEILDKFIDFDETKRSEVDCTFKIGRFPQINSRLEKDKSIGLFTNIISNVDAADLHEIYSALSGFKYVVIDVQRFFIRRATPESIAEFLKHLETFGLSNPIMLCDFGSRGQYYLFTGNQG